MRVSHETDSICLNIIHVGFMIRGCFKSSAPVYDQKTYAAVAEIMRGIIELNRLPFNGFIFLFQW